MNQKTARINSGGFFRRYQLAVLAVAILFAQSWLVSDAYANSKLQQRSIINGKNVPLGKYPWMVALLQSSVSDNGAAFFCGGTLIDRQWVLTAAHCVTGSEPGEIEIAVNEVYLKSTRVVRIPVQKIIAHSNFIDKGYRDVAVMKLARKVPDSVATIDLIGREGRVRSGTRVVAMGWGITQSGRISTRLKEVALAVGLTSACNRFTTRFYPNYELCVVSPGRSKGTCSGDSGGPIVARDAQTRKLYQIGLTSWGRGDCNTGYPGVYTRLADVAPWITRQIQERPARGESTDPTNYIIDYCDRRSCLFDASFAQSSISSEITRYSWKTDDGGSASGSQFFKHRFRRNGEHVVTLTMRLANGRRIRKNVTFNITSKSARSDRYQYKSSSQGFLSGPGKALVAYNMAGQGSYFYDGVADFKITGPAATDFDLYLSKYNMGTKSWSVVDKSEGRSSSERITKRLTAGYYRLFVASYSGAGNVNLTTSVWRSQRDVCFLISPLRCRR